MSFRRFRTIGLALLAAAALAGPRGAAADESMAITDAYIRAPQPGSHVAAGYLHIRNTTASADTLIGVATPAAAHASVHEMTAAGPVMRMRARPEGVPVPAGGEVVLAPGSLHLMLEGVDKPLRPGDHVPVTLRFSHAGAVTVPFDVRPLGASH